jgi:hypothetical protein
MKHRFLLVVVLLVLTCTSESLYAQCMYYPVSFEERVNNATYIVLGKVIAKEAYEDENTGDINTLNRLQIMAWLKNRQETTEVYIITQGGVLGNKATEFWPSLQLNEQQEYILLLDKENHQLDNKARRMQSPRAMQLMAYADAQGALPLQNGIYHDLLVEKPMDETRLFKKIQGITRQSIVTPAGSRFPARIFTNTETNARVAQVTAVTSFSPTTTHSGSIAAGDYLTISGSGFGATVGNVYFPNADDGGATYIASSAATDYVSWSDNSITLKVPTNAGTGNFLINGSMSSGTPLTITYAQLSITNTFLNFAQATRQRPHLRNLNGLGGYTFSYNTSFNSNALAVAAFERALTNWRCASGVNFSASGTTSVATAANDGVNVVFFDNTLGLPAIGQARTSYTASGFSGGCDMANTVWWVTDLDIRFRPDPPTGTTTWNFGPGAPTASQIDFETVALHELGHAHGLGHVIASGQVMHYATVVGSSSRILSANDIAGGNAIMAYSTGSTCFNPAGSGTPMTAVPASVCSVLGLGLQKFEGHRKNSNTNTLLWKTVNENNSTGYYIQRSGNGSAFSDIAFVSSKGVQSHDYIYDDVKAGNTGWYYRLQQVVAGSRSTISPSVYINGGSSTAWRVWGNESGNTIYVSGSSDGVLRLFSTTGQLVYTKPVHAGINTLLLNNIPKGIYYYRITTASATVSEKLILGR